MCSIVILRQPGATFPLITEESYTIEYNRLATDGIFGLDQVDPDP